MLSKCILDMPTNTGNNKHMTEHFGKPSKNKPTSYTNLYEFLWDLFGPLNRCILMQIVPNMKRDHNTYPKTSTYVSESSKLLDISRCSALIFKISFGHVR